MSTVTDEPPRSGPWALAHTPVLGVLGPSALVDRLGEVATVVLVPGPEGPDDQLPVDLLLVARSALAPGGAAWAGAMHPVGFDRGVALAARLRTARHRHVPVVALDDLAPGVDDGWQALLGAAVDDLLVLGPPTATHTTWAPGSCWDAAALRQATAAPAGAVPPGPARVTGRSWRREQRLAAAAGGAVVDHADPWAAHLAVELESLGLPVRGPDGAPPPGGPATTPAEALASLLARVGVEPPAAPTVRRDADGPVRADDVVVLDGSDEEAARCAAALGRLVDDDWTAVRTGDAVAAPGTAVLAARAAGVDVAATLRAAAVPLVGTVR